MKIKTTLCSLMLVVSAVMSETAGLLSVKSNSVTWMKDANAARSTSRSHRQRRQSYRLTSAERTEVIDRHNALRAEEGADNMEVMTWNGFLETLALGWAERCDFNHGQPSLGANPQYTAIGQNLYAISGASLNLTTAIQALYNEKYDYDYDTLRCADGKACGHYTQIVWSSSREVGCGYHFCTTLSSTTLTNAYYLVCNYGPAGNYGGVKPYTKGPACSKCQNGAGWCRNKLCNSNCRGPGEDCSCAAICYNCASLDREKCRCSCADGWHAADCKVVCEDTHVHCNANPGWPPSWCNHSTHSSYVRQGCPAMCHLCTPDAGAVAGECPPVLGDGAFGRATPTRFTADQSTTTLALAMITLAYRLTGFSMYSAL